MPYNANGTYFDPAAMFPTPDDPTSSVLTDAEAIINSNGGSGDWDTDQTTSIERWQFPRFDGAENLGTCKTKAAKHSGVHLHTTACKKWELDTANMYLSRSGIGGYDSDVETLVAWFDAPRNIIGASLLLGDPGTGKTALIEAAATHSERRVLTVVCTPDHNRDSLFLKFVGEGNGDCITPDHDHNEARDDFTDSCQRTAFTLGPIPYAAKWGYLLYLDEFMLLPDGVKPIVYPLADGRHTLPEANVDGSPITIHPDFRLVLSSNPMVRGASLPEPIGSRCASTTLTVETSADMLRDLNIDDAIVAAWEHLKGQNLWHPAIREMRVADYWYSGEEPNVDQAMSAFLPEHCPESQRKQVRDVVMSYLGGDLREDGRLVVS